MKRFYRMTCFILSLPPVIFMGKYKMKIISSELPSWIMHFITVHALPFFTALLILTFTRKYLVAACNIIIYYAHMFKSPSLSSSHIEHVAQMSIQYKHSASYLPSHRSSSVKGRRRLHPSLCRLIYALFKHAPQLHSWLDQC